MATALYALRNRKESLYAAVCVALAACALAPAHGATEPDAEIEPLTAVATYNELAVDIAASPDDVWRALFMRSAWMDSLVSEETLSGVPGTSGHVSEVTSRVAETIQERIEETVVAEKARHLVIKATTRNETALAFIDYELSSVAGPKTHLTLRIYLEARLPLPENAGPGTLASIRQQIETATQAKIEQDHAALKELLER